MKHMNLTAKRAVDTYGVDIIVAETLENLANLTSSIAHQMPYGNYQSYRILDAIADACIHLDMLAYIATSDDTQKDVKVLIHDRLIRLEKRLDLIQGRNEKCPK